MLNNEQEYVLSLLRLAFGKTQSSNGMSEPDYDPTEVMRIVRSSGIMPTIYSQLPSTSVLRARLQSSYYAHVSQSVNQVHEAEVVLKALGAAGLPCMGLKGWDIRKLYPNPFMRQMTDIDLLLSRFNRPLIREVMGSLGYASESEGSAEKHDVFHKGAITMELHRRLTDDSGPIQKWEALMWEHALRIDGNVYRMRDEDIYIYHFVHMHWDFINGWFGLRRVVDVWLLEQMHDSLDMAYIDFELETMGITAFRDRMCHLAHVMMGDVPMDNDSELLLHHAFRCGIYGNGKSHKLGRIAMLSRGSATSGKLKSVLAAVFLPYGRMKAQFPILEKWPVLLPFCWIKRIGNYLHSGSIARYRDMLDYSDIAEGDLDEMRRIFKAGGCL